MNYLEEISKYIAEIFGIDPSYIILTVKSLEILVVCLIIKFIIKKVYANISISGKKKFFFNKTLQIILNVIAFVSILFVWSEKLESIMTLISFISAGVAIAIREIIFDFFAGLYIRVSKPFELEDRIEIDGIRGDIINIHALGFDVLDIEEKEKGEQSTGKITHIPNTEIFNVPLKNYVKAFKYVWDEVVIDVDLNSDLEKTKKIIHNILRKDEILKTIPKNMEDAMEEATVEYRIYFNKLEPIIYTKLVKDHLELSIRFLVHPKMVRNVENNIYEHILQEYKKGNIILYTSATESASV